MERRLAGLEPGAAAALLTQSLAERTGTTLAPAVRDALLHPRPVTHLIAVAVAAALGFACNELVARYRIRTGRRIGSAALVADGLHARTDGFTSLAVLAAGRGTGPAALGSAARCGPSARSPSTRAARSCRPTTSRSRPNTA